VHHNFIDLFKAYTIDAESPDSYFKWSAYALIGAILRDNCYISLPIGSINPITRVYPNLYVILLSDESSKVRKSVPINKAKEFAFEIDNTKIITGHSSIQGVIDVLGQVKTGKNGKGIKGASGFITAQEIMDFMSDNRASNKILTDWYDFHARWDNTLRQHAGALTLTNVCVSILAASNEDAISDVFDDHAVRTGLLARSLIVFEKKVRKRNSLMYESKIEKPKKIQLIRKLEKIASLTGEFTLTDDAKAYYDNWYNNIWHRTDNTQKFSSTGSEERVHFTVLKVAMVLAASMEIRMIPQPMIEQSIKECTRLLKNSLRLSGNAGDSPIRKQIKTVITYICKKPNYQATVNAMLRDLWAEIDADVLLTRIKETVTLAGIVSCEMQGNIETWCLTKEAIKKYEEDG